MLLSPRGTVCMHLDFLSHVWNSWTHRRSPLIKANPWKHAVIFAASPWRTPPCHSQLHTAHPDHAFVWMIISSEPTWELAARLGGNNVGLVREKRGGGQRNGHALGQSLLFCWVFGAAAIVVLEVRGALAAASLQGAVGIHLVTCVECIGGCREKTEVGRCWGKSRVSAVTVDLGYHKKRISLLNMSHRRLRHSKHIVSPGIFPSEVMESWHCWIIYLKNWDHAH